MFSLDILQHKIIVANRRFIGGKNNVTWGYCTNSCPHYYGETCGRSRKNKISRFKQEWNKDKDLKVFF